MAHGVPLAVQQRAGVRRELEQQRPVIGQGVGPGSEPRLLVAVVHQPRDVHDEAGPVTGCGAEATALQRLAPGAAVWVRELDVLPGHEQPGVHEVGDSRVRLLGRRARLERARLLRGRCGPRAAGQAAVGAPPEGEWVARVRPRVGDGREVVGRRWSPRSSTTSPWLDRQARQRWTSADTDGVRRAVRHEPAGSRSLSASTAAASRCRGRGRRSDREVLRGVVGPVDAVADVGDVAEHLEAVQEAAGHIQDGEVLVVEAEGRCRP